MRPFAKARVLDVERHYQRVRASWRAECGRDVGDDAMVHFFLEVPANVYHAMVELEPSTWSEPIFFGTPDDVQTNWLDAESIRFYFGESLDEFRAKWAIG